MFEFIDTILLRFRSCFSRQAAFHWFVVIVVGFLIRSDSLGVTSVIRDLAILPSCYPCLLHFFRADSWRDELLFSVWIKTVVDLAPLKKISGRVVLIGDGVKRASDGKFMPYVKKMDGIACDSTGYASRHKVPVKWYRNQKMQINHTTSMDISLVLLGY